MISPRVISLDLDDTLWPVAPVIAAAEATLLSWLREHHPRAVLGFDVDSMRKMRDGVAERFPQKGHDLTFLRRQALAEMFAAAGYHEGPAADDAFEIFLSERNRVQFYADVLPALTRLRAKYRLFALSNGNADLERCGIADLFEGHVTASAAGAAKPDARIFAHLLRTAGVPAEEPGMRPNSAALEDEGFDDLGPGRLIGSFARHFMVHIDAWQQEGFRRVMQSYLPRLPADEYVERSIDGVGDLLARKKGKAQVERRRLVPALAPVSWFDPDTGSPRL